MRLVTFERDGRARLGAWVQHDGLIVDLAQASNLVESATTPDFESMQTLIDGGEQALDRARSLAGSAPEEAIFESKDCTLLAPLPRPVQIRDCLCFPEHLIGATRITNERVIAHSPDPDATRKQMEAAGRFDLDPSFYDFPLYYISNRMSVIGPDSDVEWPAFSNFIDFELEWAAVIGKEGRSIRAERARSHIFGYSVFNDWSARDEQARVMGGVLNLGPSSSKDFANSLGPCIVTADEFDDPYRLAMIARVNGAEVARGSTGSMHFKFEDLIAHISRGHALYPGEILCSGTVGGGCSIEAGITLAHGDVIELEVEGIGRLRNRVLAPHASSGSADDTIMKMNEISRK